MRTYKDKAKIEDKIGIISRFTNETKINYDTAIEVHGKCVIISMFKNIKTKRHKMKTGPLNTCKIKIKIKVENCQNMGIRSTIAKI